MFLANDDSRMTILAGCRRPSIPSSYSAGNIIALLYRIVSAPGSGAPKIAEEKKYQSTNVKPTPDGLTHARKDIHAKTVYYFLSCLIPHRFSFSPSSLFLSLFFLLSVTPLVLLLSVSREPSLFVFGVVCSNAAARTTCHACHMTRSCISRSWWPAASARRASDAKSDCGTELRPPAVGLYQSSGFSSWRPAVRANRQHRRLPSRSAPTQLRRHLSVKRVG